MMTIQMIKSRMQIFYRLLITVIFSLGLWGCTSFSPVAENSDTPEQHQTPPGKLPAGEGWWYLRFHIDWPEDEGIRWYMGTLIGGEVIAPVFDEYYQDVYIWRIHRRADRDGHGHVFSFIFYSTPQGAQRIYTAVESNTVVKSLLENGQLTKVTVDDVTRITRPNVEDTSDKNWPLSVQKAWPAMIMGASRMWLELVSESASRQTDISGIEAKYKKVQDDVTQLWRDEGQHAILHHLNAVYAYQPLLIRY
jgi:hypothetical protein